MDLPKMSEEAEAYSEEEAAKRRDEIVRRMIATPPQPRPQPKKKPKPV